MVTLILQRIYRPLLDLEGYVNWNHDEKYNIYYFSYKIQVGSGETQNHIRIFIYMFLEDDYCGCEYILDNPNYHKEMAEKIAKEYQKVAESIIEKRERLKRIFK